MHLLRILAMDTCFTRKFVPWTDRGGLLRILEDQGELAVDGFVK
jgi:hypothetical protein